jgi:IS5 family transposase
MRVGRTVPRLRQKQWFSLSDPAVEEALYDSPLMRQFAQIDLGSEPVPDETTVCKFRHLLEKHNLGAAILETVNVHLESRGLKITTGTIVDATIIHAPSSTKNREQQPHEVPHSVPSRACVCGDQTEVWLHQGAISGN